MYIDHYEHDDLNLAEQYMQFNLANQAVYFLIPILWLRFGKEAEI